MKKLLSILMLGLFALVACEKKVAEDVKDDVPAGKITLTSNAVMKFGVEGGQGEILFDFVEQATEASRARVVEAITVVEWIAVEEITSEKVLFSVSPNVGEARNATIKVSCGVDSFQVMVMQDGTAAADVTFEATHVAGTYYGKFLTDGGQTEGFNYFIILSDMQPAGINEFNYATEYRFDIYANEGAEFSKELRIPLGTYTLDHSRSSRAGTIDAYKDCTYLISSNGTVESFSSCTLVVSETGIVADIVLKSGEVHRVIYNDAPIVGDYSKDTYADVYPVSQYTDTLRFDVTGGFMYAYYRGDWFGTGHDVWFMHMIEDKTTFSGVYLIFNFIVPKSEGGFNNQEGYLGEYKLSNPDESLDWTFPAGRLRDDSQQLNAYYMECAGGMIDMSKAAPIKDGTIKVEKIDGNVVITVDGKDDAGNDIKGTFSGIVGIIENQGVVVK